ncbi:MAG TPA: hypothetical protein DGX96_09790 [Lachnospiraceae bacterium]|nr:hypothetical protein [Lachnospiraceae bacterium]
MTGAGQEPIRRRLRKENKGNRNTRTSLGQMGKSAGLQAAEKQTEGRSNEENGAIFHDPGDFAVLTAVR